MQRRIAVLELIVLGTLAPGCSHHSDPQSRINNYTVEFDRTATFVVTVDIENPRKAGRRSFHSRDRTAMSDEWRADTPIETYEYEVTVIRLCRINGGEIPVLSAHEDTHLQFSGWFGGLRQEWGPLAVAYGLCVGGSSELRLPSDPHITQYVFLVKSLTERTDWRVYEMTADESKRLVERREMQLPDVLTLPKAEQYQKWYGLFDAVEHYAIAHGWDVDLPAN